MVNPARAGMILAPSERISCGASKPRASGDDPEDHIGLRIGEM